MAANASKLEVLINLVKKYAAKEQNLLTERLKPLNDKYENRHKMGIIEIA